MRVFILDSPDQCIQKAKEVLYQYSTAKTVLFLSGGSTPKQLYMQLAAEEKIHPAAAGMVDERFGEKWHERSNEQMIRDTGLLKYFARLDIPWYPILQSVKPQVFDPLAFHYDAKVRELLFHFPRSVALLGIGSDGHTAGIPAKKKCVIPTDDIWNTHNVVISYNDTCGIYGQRITMTFTALSMLDHLLILAFGKDKKQALESMFTQGSLEEIPARFYNRTEISKKVTLITDQKI